MALSLNRELLGCSAAFACSSTVAHRQRAERRPERFACECSQRPRESKPGGSCGIAIMLAVGRAGSLSSSACCPSWRCASSSPRTHRADHRTLFWAFFVLPLQHWPVGVQCRRHVCAADSVYAFLFVAARIAAAQIRSAFERAADPLRPACSASAMPAL
jgi:hypothetical protein